MMEHDQQRSKAIREWIIFSLSLGLGAHIVLGFMLHSPDLWEAKSLWIYGLFASLSVYVAIQLSRAIWCFFRNRLDSEQSSESDDR